MLAPVFDGFGNAPPVEAILKVTHSRVKERPLPHRFTPLFCRLCELRRSV
jgi:hypothetical protein